MSTLISRFSHRSPIARGVEQVAEELVEELHGHAGEVGEHDDGGEDRGPAAEPPDVGAEGLGGPRERGAAVRRDLVQLAVGVGREEHRQEAGDDDHRHLARRPRRRGCRASPSGRTPARPTRCRGRCRRTARPHLPKDPCRRGRPLLGDAGRARPACQPPWSAAILRLRQSRPWSRPRRQTCRPALCTPVGLPSVRGIVPRTHARGPRPTQEEPMAQHPLEPLDEAEFRQVAAALRRDQSLSPSWRFASIELVEPPKAEVKAWTPGDPVPSYGLRGAVEPRRQPDVGGRRRPGRRHGRVVDARAGRDARTSRSTSTTRSTRRCARTRTWSPRWPQRGITDLSLVTDRGVDLRQGDDARAVARPPARLVRHLVPRDARTATPTPTRSPG